MRRALRIALTAAAILSGTAADAMYAGFEGGVLLPAGSSAIRRGGIGGAVAGWDATDGLSLEVSVGLSEGGGYGAVDALWHWTGFAVYDRYFGFSAWDPFFLGGFSSVFGDDGDYGPETGVGLFYHLDDQWALRFAAKSQFGLENELSVAFALTGGLVFSF